MRLSLLGISHFFVVGLEFSCKSAGIVDFEHHNTGVLYIDLDFSGTRLQGIILLLGFSDLLLQTVILFLQLLYSLLLFVLLVSRLTLLIGYF